MLSPYRRILAEPGALAFSTAGLVGRMPMAMIGLGIVLLVSDVTGSYGLAGSISAAEVLAAAVAGPLQGRLFDRFGQFWPLLVQGVGYGLALSATVVAIEAGWPTPVPHLVAALAGVLFPQTGSCVRARWTQLLRGRGELQTAYALEAVADEVVFLVGPVIVTVLATQVHRLAGLGVALVLGVIGTLALAVQRRTEPVVTPGAATGARAGALGWGTLAPLVVSSVALGSLFGSVEVVTVAFATEEGQRAAAGPMLALWASGSLLAGLITGAVSWRISPVRRYRIGAGAMAATMLPLPFLPGLSTLGPVLFLAGFAIAPTLVAAVAVVQATVPPARLTEGISWATTGVVAGVAPGAAIAGRVVDRAGASAGYWVAVVSGLLAASVALALRERRTARRAAAVLDHASASGQDGPNRADG